MEFKRMMAEHVSQVAELEKQCFSSPWSEKSVSSELSNPLSLWIVATENNRVVGYVGSQSVIGEADMMNIAVAPEYRRRGVANALIIELISQLASRDVHSLTLEVRASNIPAITLYEKLDFVQVGCRPNYYSSPKEDALILRKEWIL